ncbi:MAG TPA: ABC transporter substrate-binding protein, partial [Azospirillaceae bacterium]|nr:ABC transporter substrate-binding protein [Azospirillaceae bacterium]
MAFLLLFLALLFSVVGAASAAPAAETPLRPVRLQLKWTHQFQFAGFYAAVEQGFYRDAGFDVTLLEGRPDADPVHTVAEGKADFGIGNSGLVLWRAKGAPIMAVAAIFQHSPFVMLARRDERLQSVHDLAGRKLMLEEHAAELLAYLKMERAPIDRMTVVPHSGDVGALIRGEVDAISAYSTTEPFDLQAAGFAYNVFNPRAAGIDFYGDTLFTHEKLAKNDPAMVSAFRDASMRGWRYALENLEEMVDVIIARYAPLMSREKLMFEAHEIRRLMLADMVEVGYMYEGRWRHIVDGFAAAGLAPPDLPLDDFLFDPDRRPDLTRLYLGLGAALAFSAILIWVSARFAALNRKLNVEVAGRRLLEEELRRLASTDPLTGLYNRRRFQEAIEREMARARRYGHSLSLLLADLDHFKRINDQHGHAAGDRALQIFADICRLSVRSLDAVGRMGGEEFAILLPETDADGALLVAERIRAETEAMTAEEKDVPAFTVSIGVATLTERPAENESRKAPRTVMKPGLPASG